MREVKPEVYGPVSKPAIDWGELRRYLSDVGADAWADKREPMNRYQTIGAGDTLVEVGGRLCYRSWEPGLNANVSRVRENQEEYLGNILKSGHGSVAEHANYSFILHDVSRVVTHEFVRHRAGVAISQESMRFVRLTDIPFWMPDWAKEDDEFMERALKLLAEMEAFQVWMAQHFGLDDEGVPFSEKKAKTSFMRRFAPIGVATGLMTTLNVRSIRHIIAMRTSLGAEEEIRIVCDQIATKMLRECPGLMQDYRPDENRAWVPEFLKI